ncbi:hypothetical protein WL92_18600 [Burkholderia multivorans]|nr:hypothetical protein WL91_25300 [Burkholderia multivorans]KWF77716.1 hypothetical protein WL92_18600 [Burkholderia multivorans]
MCQHARDRRGTRAGAGAAAARGMWMRRRDRASRRRAAPASHARATLRASSSRARETPRIARKPACGAAVRRIAPARCRPDDAALRVSIARDARRRA